MDSSIIEQEIAKINNMDDLMDVNALIKSRHRELSQKQANKFSKGDRVSWKSKKQFGRTITGTVVRVNTKSVTVDADDGTNWRVSPGLVFHVEDTEIVNQ